MKRLTINRIASASLRTNKKSYIALVIGIFLSIFFVSCMVLGVHGLFMANEARRDARLGSQDAFWLDCEETDEVLMASGLYDGIGHVTIPAVHNDTSTSVGYYDDTAAAFLHRSFIEGRMPEKPGEIAIEESALARMRLDNVGVGDTVTLTLTPVEGVDEVRTFTVVGIMENQSANMKGYSSFSELYMEFPAILIHPTEAELSTGRLVQHKLFSFAPGVMGYQALTYYTRTDAQGAQTYGNLRVFDGNDNPTNWPSDLIAPNPAVLLYTVCIGVLAGTLLLATCVGIAGAMESQLSRRVSEIGMLRAVGATKKQIRRIFGREALLLALIVSPLAMLAGCGAAWTLEQAAPDAVPVQPVVVAAAAGAGAVHAGHSAVQLASAPPRQSDDAHVCHAGHRNAAQTEACPSAEDLPPCEIGSMAAAEHSPWSAGCSGIADGAIDDRRQHDGVYRP